MKKPLSKASSVLNVTHATGPAGKAKTKTQVERTRSKLVHQFNAKLGWTTESETKMISNIQNNMLRRTRIDNPAASKGRSQKIIIPRSKSTQLDEYGSGPVVEHCVIPPCDLDSARLERAYEDELVLMNKRSSYRSDTAVGFVPVAPHLKK